MDRTTSESLDQLIHAAQEWKRIAESLAIVNKHLNNELKKCNCRQGSNNEGQKH